MSDTRRRTHIAVLVPIVGAAAIVAIQIWDSLPWKNGTPSPWDSLYLAMLAFTVLPHMAIALGLMYGHANGRVWWPILIYGVLASAGGTAMGISIITSDSSTAVLGYLSLPIYQLFGMLPAAAIAALINTGYRRRRNQRHELS